MLYLQIIVTGQKNFKTNNNLIKFAIINVDVDFGNVSDMCWSLIR